MHKSSIDWIHMAPHPCSSRLCPSYYFIMPEQVCIQATQQVQGMLAGNSQQTFPVVSHGNIIRSDSIHLKWEINLVVPQICWQRQEKKCLIFEKS